MSPAYIPIAALLVAAVAVQVWYARSIVRSGVVVNRATKVVWIANIALLLGVLGFLTWFMLAQGGS
jgi:hypothetical protein